MDYTRWLMKAKRWAQNPPSTRQVVMTFAVIAICLAIVAVEWFGLWPEGFTVHKMRP